MRTVTFTIPMDYPGWSISKNGLWHGGDRRRGLNPEAKRWREALAESVRMWLLGNGIRAVCPPVHVEVGGRFFDRAHCPDMHNLGELVCDAVQDGTGISDQEFTLTTQRPEFSDKALPEIRVTVTLTVQEEQP